MSTSHSSFLYHPTNRRSSLSLRPMNRGYGLRLPTVEIDPAYKLPNIHLRETHPSYTLREILRETHCCTLNVKNPYIISVPSIKIMSGSAPPTPLFLHKLNSTSSRRESGAPPWKRNSSHQAFSVTHRTIYFSGVSSKLFVFSLPPPLPLLLLIVPAPHRANDQHPPFS